MGSKKKSTTQTQNSSTTFNDHPLIAGRRETMFGKADGAYDKALGALNQGGAQNGYVGIGNNPTKSSGFFGQVEGPNTGTPAKSLLPFNAGFQPQQNLTWGQQQVMGQDNVIGSARQSQDYFRRVLNGDLLNPVQRDVNGMYGSNADADSLAGHLNAIQKARNDGLSRFEQDLSDTLNFGGAYQNANAPQVASDMHGDYNTPFDLALSQALLGNYQMERGYQNQAPQGLQQAHGLENLVHDARQQDAQNQTVANLTGEFGVHNQYNDLLNANRLGHQEGTATSTTTTKSKGSAFDTLMRLGEMGLNMYKGGMYGAAKGAMGALSGGGANNMHLLPRFQQPGYASTFPG